MIWFFMFLPIIQILIAEEFKIHKHSFMNDDDLDCVALFDSTLFIGGDDEHIYRSLDFGTTWTKQKLRGVNGDADVIFQAKNGTLLAGVNEWDAHYITVSKENTFYAQITINAGNGDVVQVDSRPSDALALALRARVPIYVEEEVMAKASISPEVMRLDDEEELKSVLENLRPEDLYKV